MITPDDERAPRLAGLLDPRQADAFVAHARDDQDDSLDALDVIAARPGEGVPGRYIGVHHTLVGGVFTTKLATSDDLISWTHRADLDTHASQPTLAALPDGGFVLAAERDTPDEQYVSRSNLVLRHYDDWDALAGGDFDRQVDLPRTLAATAEGTPALSVVSWDGPDASQIAVTFHYLKNISVDRQAVGTVTNFSASGWSPQPDAPLNSLMVGLGTRGNLGDRADLLFEGHPYAVVEAQSVKANFGTWRWYLYDRERNEARLLALQAPAGSYALGNPTVRTLPGPSGRPLVLTSGYIFSEGAAAGEAGQFIALRYAATDPIPGPVSDPAAPPRAPAPGLLVPAALAPSVLAVPARVIADTRPPTATLAGRTQKLGRTVVFSIACSDEACRATMTARVRVPPHGGLKAKTFTLKAITRRIAEGTRTTAHLMLPASARTHIRGALRAGRAISVRVRVRVTDGPAMPAASRARSSSGSSERVASREHATCRWTLPKVGAMPIHQRGSGRSDTLHVRPQVTHGDGRARGPRLDLPQQEMPADSAYQIVHDELMLDGNARLNLATFVTTWMEPAARALMAECIDKNMIDKDEYPQTAELERRCVSMLARLWGTSADGPAVGCSTTGSSEAAMLAGMALKRRWAQRRRDAGLPADRPNLVMGANVQVCWDKFCRYWDVEPRSCPSAAGARA